MREWRKGAKRVRHNTQATNTSTPQHLDPSTPQSRHRRKPLYPVARHGLVMHVVLRSSNVWSWYAASLYCLGGDVYFPVMIAATASALLHLRYVLNLLHVKQVLPTTS